MSRAGEHKKGNFPYDFLCKNNFMLFLPEINHRKIINEILSWGEVINIAWNKKGNRRNEILSCWGEVINVWI